MRDAEGSIQSTERLSTRVIIAQDDEQWTAWAAEEFVWTAAASVMARGAFHVVVPGGSTPRAVLGRVSIRRDVIVDPSVDTTAGAGSWKNAGSLSRVGRTIALDDVWPHTHVYFGDERGVGPDHPDSNFRMVRDTWLAKVPIPEHQVHRIPGERPLEEAARDYADLLSATFDRIRGFDLVVLGLGPDGHTASLIPGTPLDYVAQSSVGVGPAPLSPAKVRRVTMTAAALRRTSRTVFWTKGAEKADVVHSALGGDGIQTIVPEVLPNSGTVTWMLDSESAAGLR